MLDPIDPKLRAALLAAASRLEHEFERGVYLRGVDYARQALVSDIGYRRIGDGGWVLNAAVNGSDVEPYRTTVELSSRGAIRATSCTCPYEYRCKHAAAVLVTLIEQHRSSGAEMNEPLRAESAPEPGKNALGTAVQPLAREVRDWLSMLEAPSNGAKGAHGVQHAKRSRTPVSPAYFLDDSRGKSGTGPPVLTLGTVMRDAGGEICVPTGYSELLELFDSGALQPEGEEHRLMGAIGSALGAWRPSYYGEDPVTISLRPNQAELFDIALRTGRLFLGSAIRGNVRVIGEGPERTVRPSWRFTPKGHLRTACDAEDLTVLPFADARYVDPISATAGKLLAVPHVDLGAWLTCPLIKREQFPALKARFAALGLPEDLAPPVEGKAAVSAAPTAAELVLTGDPSCRLSLDTSWAPDPKVALLGERSAPYPIAELRMSYGDGSIPIEDKRDVIEPGPGAKDAKIVVRDRSAEQRLRAELSDSGLVPLGSVPFAHRVANQRGRLAVNGWNAREILEKWRTILDTKLPALRERGWRITIDPQFPIGPSDELNAFDGTLFDAEGDANRWFEGELGMTVGDTRVDLLPILRYVLSTKPHVLEANGGVTIVVDGRFVKLPLERLQPLADTVCDILSRESNGKLRLSTIEALQFSAALRESESLAAEPEVIASLRKKIAQGAGLACNAPAGFRAELRPYQARGLGWLRRIAECRLGGVLADDMGLGKTVQSLALIWDLKRRGKLTMPALIVAPTSVLPNWSAEVARFTPKLRAETMQGPGRSWAFEEREGRAPDLLLTSYALLARDARELSTRQFSVAIFDEAQFIKNPQTKSYQVAAELKAELKVVCTGTPVENHLEELWAHFNLVTPGLLGSRASFRTSFRSPIERDGNTARKAVLARRIEPFLLRRTKSEVLTDLPPLTEIVNRVPLAPAQAELYESVRLMMDKRLRKVLAEKGLARSKIEVLDALLKLRQVCCDPRLLKTEAAAKCRASAKLEALLELIETLRNENRRTLLFSQFTSMLALIISELESRKIPFELLTGESDDRRGPVERFQRGDVPLMLLSLKAGGVGLNLSAADTVIIYDPWWNPAVESQALSRAHRIGQTQPVFVHRLVATGTIEEKIAELQQRKRALVEGLLGEGDEHLERLDEAILGELLTPGK